MSELSNLINLASEKNWCTRLYCTTCGALDFRSELRKLSNEEILEDLRDLPETFCERHSEVLRLVFVEIAMFPTCIDLIDALENTPAGAILESAIRHSKCIEERRREHEQWSSPEAAKKRAVERRRTKATAHHLRLSEKAVTDRSLRVFQDMLSQSNFKSFFAELSKVEDASVGRAIGGLAYSALNKRLRHGNISAEEALLLETYASKFGGHWEKLRKARSPN